MNKNITKLYRSSLIRLEYPSSSINNTKNTKPNAQFYLEQSNLISKIWHDIRQRLIEVSPKTKAIIQEFPPEEPAPLTQHQQGTLVRGRSRVQQRKEMFESPRHKTEITTTSFKSVCDYREDKIENIRDTIDAVYDNPILQNLSKISFWLRSVEHNPELYSFLSNTSIQQIGDIPVNNLIENVLKNLEDYKKQCSSMSDIEKLQFCNTQIEEISSLEMNLKTLTKYEKNACSIAINFWRAEQAVATHHVFLNNFIINVLKNKNTSLNLKLFLEALDPIEYKNLFKIYFGDADNKAYKLFKNACLIISTGVVTSIAIVIKMILENSYSKEASLLAVCLLLGSILLSIAMAAKDALSSHHYEEQALKAIRNALQSDL